MFVLVTNYTGLVYCRYVRRDPHSKQLEKTDEVQSMINPPLTALSEIFSKISKPKGRVISGDIKVHVA